MHWLLDYSFTVSNPLTWLLFLAGLVGHTFFLTTSLNVLYAWPLPKKLLKITRKVDILLVLAGPVLFWFVLGLPDGTGLPRGGFWPLLATTYALFCWFLGFVVAPIAMVLYHLRREPSALVSNHTQTIDVAKELGYPPVGRGKYRHLARLPFNQCFQVDIVERTFTLPQLPKTLDGLTILHLTDLHLCGTPDRIFYQHVLDRCQKDYVPDLVAITGDIVDTHWHHRWILPVLGRLRWKHAGFAILGNHDYWYEVAAVRRRLSRLGLVILGNRWVQIEIAGTPLVVVGHEGPWFKPGPDLKNCPEAPFRLCLSHTPDNIRWARYEGMDLVLAGHVHGGQIRVPGIGSLFVPSRYSRRYDCGNFWEPPTLMHVGRGLAGQHPLRYNCRPEITRIRLTCGLAPTTENLP